MALARANNITFLSADDGSTPVVFSDTVSVEFSSSIDMVDFTTKDSDGTQEVEPGLESSTITFSGYADFDDGESVDKLYTAFLAKTKQDFQIRNSSTNLITGEGYFSEFSFSAGQNDKVDFSGTMVTTGTVTNAIA